jgi:hypothetical protein
VFVVVVFVAVKAGEGFVELRAVGIIFYSALEEIPAEREIFSLCFDAECEARLRAIVQGGGARVPRHVPGGHVPKQKGTRLQRRDLPE